tara:strand:+ start:36 stop:260 length:225 start_codon:yes stop_codon:yes gene_type:complete
MIPKEIEVESSNNWIGNTVNFVLEDSIYLRLHAEGTEYVPHGTTIWYKASSNGGFYHVIDDRKLNKAWGKYELQ